MHADSLLQVDLNAIARNLAAFARLGGPGASCCAVVKSDGYGLGVRHTARALVEAGASMLAVFRVSEALDLLSLDLEVPILVLGPVLDLSPVHPLAAGLADGRVHLVLHDARHLKAISQIRAQPDRTIAVHLEIDTGMCRGGCAPGAAAEIVAQVRATPCIRLAGVMTHFTSAGTDPAQTDRQHARFLETLGGLGPLDPGCLVHAAATAAALRAPVFHHSMLRIGLGWCGYVPGDRSLERALPAPLVPAIRWTSRIVHVRSAQASQTVGYGGRWHAARDTSIGIIPVGYADGMPIQAGAATGGTAAAKIAVLAPSRTGQRRVEGFVDVVGAVSMDQVAVDLGSLSDPTTIGPGREVEIISPDPNSPASLCRLAARCGLTPHQVLAGIGPRVQRAAVSVPEAVQAISGAAG